MTLFLACAIQATLTWAINPGKSIAQYVHDIWKTEDGLPQDSIQAILQSRQGYLWLGTQEGIARFDGARFEVFDKKRIPALRDNYVMCLHEDETGALWVGTRGGGLTRLRFQEEEFRTYTIADGLGSDFIYAIESDPRGNLWVGTTGGLSRFQDGKFVTFTTRDGLADNTVAAIVADPGGGLWLGTMGGGVSRLRDGAFATISSKEGLPDGTVRAIRRDRRGNLWLGTENGLARMKDGRLQAYTTRDGLSDNGILSLYEDRQGVLWVGTDGGGLNRIVDGTISSFTMREGLSQNAVLSILEDREGSLWIGTGSGGLNRFKDGMIVTYTTLDGLSDNLILSVYQDGEGRMWIGTANGGLNSFSGGRFAPFRRAGEMPGRTVQAILVDRRSTLWVGTVEGLFALEGGRFFRRPGYGELSNPSVTALCEDEGGGLWVGTRDGLNLLFGGRLTVFKTEQGLSDNFIHAILQDRKKDLWVGTNNGLNRRRGGAWRTYTTRDGLSNNFIYSLYEDPQGALWIGTRGGLNRLIGETVTRYTVASGMFDDVVFQILEDAKGHLWMSCNKGIYEIAKDELDRFARGEISRIRCRSYGVADGMKNRECCGGLQPSGWKGQDGRLWFATIEGLTVIDPALSLKKNETPPPVIIERIRVEGKDIRIRTDAEAVFPPGTEKFEFHFTAPSFQAAEKVRFQYQLQGMDRLAVDGGGQRAAYYTNLPPGHYSFHVTASNADGVWNAAGTSFAFYVRPFFFQTWWFYLLCGLALALSTASLYRFRTGRLERRKKELEQLVEQRTEQLANANRELKQLSIVASETDNAVFIMDAQGNLEWVNEGCLRMHGTPGLTQEQMIEKLGRTILSASSNPDIRNVVATAVRNKRSVTYESYLRDAAGETRWLQTTLTPIFDREGNLTKLVAIDSDISKIKAAEAALVAARQDAERANRAKSDFLSRMSHELRTPMNSILGFAQLMESDDREPLAKSHRESLRHILKGGRHLLGLINEVLDLARIESGRLQISIESVAVAPLVDEALAMVRPLAEARGIRVQNAVPAAPAPRVLADAGRLKQVLLNLLSNAVKYNRDDGLVTVEAEERPEDRLRLSVTDTGPGIPLEQQALAFEPFHRLGADRMAVEGSGIGLAISRKLTEAMSGTLGLTSAPGLGTCFHIELPLSREVPPPSSATAPGASPGPRAKGEKTILYIEDDPANLALIEHVMVRRPGIRLLFAPQGNLGVELARVHQPDIILLDIHLPDIPGHEVCRRLKEDAATRSIPLLIVSASAMPKEIDSMIQAGAASYLTKPLDIPLFLETIDRFLESPPAGAP